MTESDADFYCVELHVIVRGLDTAVRVEKELDREAVRIIRPPGHRGVYQTDVSHEQLSTEQVAAWKSEVGH